MTYHPNGPDDEGVVIDFTPPFRRVNLLEDLQKAMDVEFPCPTKFHTDGEWSLV